MQKSTKNIIVLGAGRSGVWAAIFAKEKGFNVFVSDANSIAKKYKSLLEEHQIAFEENTHSLSLITKADLIIKSPGIPNNTEVIKTALAQNKEVISDIAFALRYSKAKVIAITGSNGKTTTTMLIYHILKAAQYKVAVAGNMEESICKVLLRNLDIDYLVLEMSSFQLDDTPCFKPYIAVLLNITPDHLDRYENNFMNYAKSKIQITIHQKKTQHFIYNHDDPTIQTLIKSTLLNATKHPISIKENVKDGGFLHEQNIHTNTQNQSFTMSISDLALQGKHNYYNSLAAAVASQLLDIRKPSIKASLMNYQNQPHRMEFVAKIHGVEYINDSKATNVNAAWYALESINSPIIWIAGGKDKGNDYKELAPLVKQKVKSIICLGKENQKLHSAFEGMVDQIIDTDTAYKAVQAAYKLAEKNDIVLLSPCCASFDLFEDYKDRGDQFKEAVRAL